MKIFRALLLILIISIITMDCGYSFGFKNKNTQVQQTQQADSANKKQEQTETTYPQDVDSEELEDDELEEDIDVEQMYRDMPVPEFRYMHDIDPEEFHDTMYTTWSPYPLFRLTAPLFFKSVRIDPGYYLLTPREHDGAYYILFKEMGKVKYIVPCYKKEMVPVDFYKNHLVRVKMTRWQLKREKFLKRIGEKFDSSKRKPIPDTYLEADDLDNNFISFIIYWGNYRYYFVLRTIQL